MSTAGRNPEGDGEHFGSYELVRYLTAGGMADLYLARHPAFENPVVVKRIQSRYLDHTRVVKMFLDEGRIAQHLDHPNIVKILDVGSVDGQFYIAMEYIAGHDLIDIARRGVESGRFLPRPIAVAIVAQAASGLAYAHSRRDLEANPLHIVHCDISPGNIVVSVRGTAKIVDFGIARATIMARTEDGVAGKYNYMAPEQVRGELVDARSDLFSLGVILYELTVGKRLFRGRPEVVMRAVTEGRIVPPSEIRPDYPLELEGIVMRLLQRDPFMRYSTAGELRADLRAWLATVGDVGKREIALYLRDLFRAPRVHSDDEISTDDEELELERSMPLVEDDLEVDPDDDEEEESPTFSAAWGAAAVTPEPPREPEAEPAPFEPAPPTLETDAAAEFVTEPVSDAELDDAHAPPPRPLVRSAAAEFPVVRRRRRRKDMTAILVGAAMFLAAIGLLIAYVIVGR